MACPKGDALILDSEVLMVDTKTGKPLPFGTLGIHKKAKFSTATPCLFIFDILQFNGENLMHKPFVERRWETGPIPIVYRLIKTVKAIKPTATPPAIRRVRLVDSFSRSGP